MPNGVMLVSECSFSSSICTGACLVLYRCLMTPSCPCSCSLFFKQRTHTHTHMHCKGTGDSTEHEAPGLGNKDTTALRTVGAELTKEQRSSTSHIGRRSDRSSGRQRTSKPAQQMTTDGTSARSAHKGPEEQTAATWRCTYTHAQKRRGTKPTCLERAVRTQ